MGGDIHGDLVKRLGIASGSFLVGWGEIGPEFLKQLDRAAQQAFAPHATEQHGIEIALAGCGLLQQG